MNSHLVYSFIIAISRSRWNSSDGQRRRSLSILKAGCLDRLGDKMVLHDMINNFVHMFDKTAAFEHPSTSEICRSWWYSFMVLLDSHQTMHWKKKSYHGLETESGRSFGIWAVWNFKSPYHTFSVDICVNLLIWKKIICHECILPIMSSPHGVFFALTQESSTNFTGQSFLWTVQRSMGIPPSISMLQQAFKLSSHSRKLSKRFDTACEQIISTRKKHTK